MSIQRLKSSGEEISVLLKMALDDKLTDLSLLSVGDKLLHDWNSDNFLDYKHEVILREALK